MPIGDINGSSMARSMLIRVPRQTNGRPDLILFDSPKESHVKGILAKLAELYKGEPVGSVAIGRLYGMNHHQVLVYLHMAKDAGQATPVYSNAGGVIRGWVPEGVEVKHTLAEKKALQTAEVLKRIYVGKPVTARLVAEQLGKPTGTVARWLVLAASMKLVRKAPTGYGWLPR